MQREDGRLQVLRTSEELAALMAGVDKRGVRELALFDALEKVLCPLTSIPQVSWAMKAILSAAGRYLLQFLHTMAS